MCPRQSKSTPYPLRLTPYPLRLRPYALRLTPYPLRLGEGHCYFGIPRSLCISDVAKSRKIDRIEFER
jgi:hypothetical protein